MSTELTDPPDSLPQLRLGDTTILSAGTMLVRIYTRRGPHPTRPDRLRHWGPSVNGRFEHHERDRDGKPCDHLDDQGRVAAAVAYFGVRRSPVTPPPRHGRIAVDSPIVTAVAEAFQANRVIDCSDLHGLAIMATRADREVLDLSSGWATRAGAGNHLATGPRPQTQAWARAIYSTYPDLAGITWSASVHPAGRALVLNERAADGEGVVTIRLDFDRALDDPTTVRIMEAVADIIGYELV